MMDENNYQSVKNDPTSETDDWRAEFTHEIRQKVVNKILEKLKSQVSSDPNTLNRLNNVAMQFEEKLFRNATTKVAYMSGIYKKMTPIENSYNHSIAVSSSNSGLTQTSMVDAVGHSSSLENVPGLSYDFVANSVGQGMKSNIFANSYREMSGSQPLQQVVYQPHQRQQLQHQLFMHNIQQTNFCPSLIQQNIHHSHNHQQQQHIVSQPTQLQRSQEAILATQSHEQQLRQQPNATEFQRSQHYGQQSNVSGKKQQLPLCRQNMPNSFQQPPGLQSNFPGMPRPKMVGPQSNTLNLQPHQHSPHILQQAEVTDSQKKVQQTSQPIQLHQLLGSQMQSNSSQQGMQQRLQTSAVLLQPENVIDQQKLQSQRVLPEASSVSVGFRAPTELANVADWHDQAYQELQSMREKYLPELRILCDMASHLFCQSREPEKVEKYTNNKIAMEKMMKFLEMPRSDIVYLSREKLDHYKQVIIRCISSIQSKNTFHQRSAQLQPPGGHSQISQVQQDRNLNIASTSTQFGSLPLLSSQQGVPNSPLNMVCSLQTGSRMGLEQKHALSPLQHGSARSIPQNIMGAPQQTNFSQQSTTIIPLQQQKQQQKHQMVQQQNLKQNIRSQWFQQKKQQMLAQNIQPCVSPRMLQQHHSISQQSDCPHQTLLPTNHRFLSASPQTSQHSSPQIDQQNLLSPLSRAGTPLQSATSPFIIASPSTPLTPSSVPVDLEKHSSGVSPLSNPENDGNLQTAENVIHPQRPDASAQAPIQTQIHNQSPDIHNPGKSASPLLTGSTCPDSNQQSCAQSQPLERLLKAVESISSKALSASVHEIGSVIKLIDWITGSTADSESKGAIGEDLVFKTGCHLLARNFNLQFGCALTKRLKRHINIIALDPLSSSVSENDSFKQFTGQIYDLSSTATTRLKRRRIEPNNKLLEEIRDVNEQMVETVVELDPTEDAATTEAGEGTIVRCSYSALALDKLHYASTQILQSLSVRLLVPANYPSSSPIILDEVPVDYSCGSKQSEEKTRSRFSGSLCNLSEPMSLGEMAITWDICARAVFSEHAQHSGGNFSSRYGTWENCITASCHLP